MHKQKARRVARDNLLGVREYCSRGRPLSWKVTSSSVILRNRIPVSRRQLKPKPAMMLCIISVPILLPLSLCRFQQRISRQQLRVTRQMNSPQSLTHSSRYMVVTTDMVELVTSKKISASAVPYQETFPAHVRYQTRLGGSLAGSCKKTL